MKKTIGKVVRRNVPPAVNHEVERLQKELVAKANKAKEQIDDVLLNLSHRVNTIREEKIEPKLKNGRIQAQTVSDLALNIAHSVSNRAEVLKETMSQKKVVRRARITAHRTRKKIRKVLHT